MVKDKFSFGKKPRMSQLVPGTDAEMSFNGNPEIVETEWGEKFSFPITLHSHDSYSSFPIECSWETKADVGKEIWDALNAEEPNADFVKAYNTAKWKLTRFDTGTYWIDQL